MDKKQICVKFAREICDILDIPVPVIKLVSADRMHTGTQIAALTPDAVLIRDDIAVSPELFFALAHELRHAHQIAHGESLEEYRTSDRISIEQYNLLSQLQEMFLPWQKLSKKPLKPDAVLIFPDWDAPSKEAQAHPHL